MTFISPMANKLAKWVFHAANIKEENKLEAPSFLWDTSHALAAFIMRPQAEAQIGASDKLTSTPYIVNI
ncbi:hypothetical protein OAI47_00350 [Rhodospirillaceae bacterium]|nr:hypothetical protein [Rhodospirillaceae bacterium]